MAYGTAILQCGVYDTQCSLYKDFYLPTNRNQNACMCTNTNLLQPLEVLPEEGHGPVWPGGAQLNNAVLQQLLNVVFLHVLLTLSETPLLLAARTSRCHDDNRNPAL